MPTNVKKYLIEEEGNNLTVFCKNYGILDRILRQSTLVKSRTNIFPKILEHAFVQSAEQEEHIDVDKGNIVE